MIAYLVAACSANVAVTLFGYAALPYTAFIMIPFDMTARDVLHEKWADDYLFARMAALVFSGSFLSWLVCNGSPSVCLASGVAFLVAGIVDTVVYAILHRSHRLVKMNSSNLFSSITDSIVFPLVAFGLVDSSLFIKQVFLKFTGGAVWSVVFNRITK